MLNKASKIILVVLFFNFTNAAIAGVVITSMQNKTSETSIYQKGIAIFLKNRKVNFIIDTNTKNCIAINHKFKRYIFIKCNKFKSVVKLLNRKKQIEIAKEIPFAVQEMMTGNQPPKTPITIKRSGRGSYEGYPIEKYQFIVDDEIVSEYWMTKSVTKKIRKEIDLEELENIYKNTDKDEIFKDGLNAKIKKKLKNFKKNQVALKEFRYTGSKTKKIIRKIKLMRVKIRKFMPSKRYKITSSITKFFEDDSEL